MKKYQIIYADPPWSYYNDKSVSPDCTTIKGFRRPPYPVLSVKDIMAFGVKEIIDKNCALFMWTTDYHLEKALLIAKKWGFNYKTIAFAWQKLNKNNKPVEFMGAYTKKSGIELCLLFTKGNMNPLIKSHKVSALIQSQRQEHSKKPDEIRERIVSLFGDLPRIELFARQKFDGWDCFGNEVESDVNIQPKEER